jgi:hypothetical protein
MEEVKKYKDIYIFGKQMKNAILLRMGQNYLLTNLTRKCADCGEEEQLSKFYDIENDKISTVCSSCKCKDCVLLEDYIQSLE